MWLSLVLLILATCSGQQLHDSVANLDTDVEISERLFYFTYTVTATSFTTTTSTLSTARTCMSSKASCKRKRSSPRFFLIGDDEVVDQDQADPSHFGFEEDSKLIEPSAVGAVEPTRGPGMDISTKREAREAQYFYDIANSFQPLMANARFNPYFRTPSNYFRQGLPEGNVYQPNERFWLTFTTSTSVSTVTTTATSTTTTFTIIFCNALVSTPYPSC